MVERLTALRGQDRALSHLARCLRAGAVPPALLFSGPEGVGKETAARAFAASLLCVRRGPRGEACGLCPECRLAEAGNHPNLLRVEPEENFIRIDEIRALREELALKAFSDRPRVLLIVPADRMTVQAANALLKTLEEPPPGTHMILVAHRASQVPPTIVSRCRRISFGPLSKEDVLAVLDARPAGTPRYGAVAAGIAAAAGGGSPGRALALLPEIAEGRENWLALLAKHDPAAVIEAAEGQKKGGDEGGGVAVALTLLRDLALLSSDAEADIMNGDLRDTLRALSARKPAAVWAQALRDLLRLTRLPPQAQKRLALEAFLFSLHGRA